MRKSQDYQEINASRAPRIRPSTLLLALPRPPTGTMSDVVDDQLIRPDLIHNQVVPNWKSPEPGVACCRAQVPRFCNQRCCLFDASDKACRRLSVVLRNVSKNLFKVRKSAAFIAKLHALR